MKAVFVETVKLVRELGLARLGAVALDGCKLATDTSKHKAMGYGRMQEDSVQDANAAKEALENMKRDLGQSPDNLVADAAYGNQHTVDSCRDHGVTPVCAVSREGKEGKNRAAIDEFGYDHENKELTCPHGGIFEFSYECPSGEQAMYLSRAPLSCGCASYMLKDGRGRLKVHKGHFAKRELKRIMGGKKELYRRRKCTVEPVLGQIQVGMGFRRYFYRGRANVRSEWNLVCAALNVKKITALLRAVKADLGRNSAGESLFELGWRKSAQPVRLFRALIVAISGEVAPLAQYG